MEPSGQNVGFISYASLPATGKPANLNSNWLSLASALSDELWQVGNIPSGSSSVAVWVHPITMSGTLGNRVSIISSNTTNVPGPQLYLETTTVGPPRKAKLCYTNTEVETGTVLNVCTASDAITEDTYFHVVALESPFFVGKARLQLYLNGSLSATTNEGYYTSGGVGLLEVGAHRDKYIAGPINQYLDAYLSQLLFYGRPLRPAEITLLYNSGNGRAYPFDTE